MAPLLEFDGYYVLSDLTNVNALRRKALRFVCAELIARPRWPRTRLERGFVAYTLSATAYILAMTLLVLSGVPALVEGILPASIGGRGACHRRGGRRPRVYGAPGGTVRGRDRRCA